jgi:CheY-like chemotaxis protein
MKTSQKILIIDDDIDMSSYLAATVRSTEGSSVDIANDPYEAIEMIFARRYDLILLDINLPDLDGYKTIQILSKHLDQNLTSTFQMWRDKVPVVLMSSNQIPRRQIRSDHFYVASRVQKRGTRQDFWSQLSSSLAEQRTIENRAMIQRAI